MKLDGESDKGYTLFEMLIVAVIIGGLTTLIVPTYRENHERSKLKIVVSDVRVIEIALALYKDEHGGDLPQTLAEIDRDYLVDPWGYPYDYQRIITLPNGKKAGELKAARKDKFLKPLNDDYDLFSPGLDGETKPSLAAAVSQDDVVRALDGAFVGLAEDF